MIFYSVNQVILPSFNSAKGFSTKQMKTHISHWGILGPHIIYTLPVFLNLYFEMLACYTKCSHIGFFCLWNKPNSFVFQGPYICCSSRSSRSILLSFESHPKSYSLMQPKWASFPDYYIPLPCTILLALIEKLPSKKTSFSEVFIFFP